MPRIRIIRNWPARTDRGQSLLSRSQAVFFKTFFLSVTIHYRKLFLAESLRGFLNSSKEIYTKTMCLWAGQIAEVIEYLHNFKPPVIHGDIKADNSN